MRKRRRQATSRAGWWRSPGLILFAVVLAMAALGWVLFFEARSRSPVRQATIDGLYVRLEQARWVEDQMLHDGRGFARPKAMMPGMPDTGFQRLSVELAMRNLGSARTPYRGEEFSLTSSGGETYIVRGADLGTADLDAGQYLNATLFFDIDTVADPGPLTLIWSRAKKTVYMSIPPPPVHYHAQPRGDVTWPPGVTVLLPIGNRDRGEDLFKGAFGCVACHGDPEEPGSNLVGPHLGEIGSDAEMREPQKSGPQYIYESILLPNDSIAPTCKDGSPCAVPSAMPDYSRLLALQEMADAALVLGRAHQDPFAARW